MVSEASDVKRIMLIEREIDGAHPVGTGQHASRRKWDRFLALDATKSTFSTTNVRCQMHPFQSSRLRATRSPSSDAPAGDTRLIQVRSCQVWKRKKKWGGGSCLPWPLLFSLPAARIRHNSLCHLDLESALSTHSAAYEYMPKRRTLVLYINFQLACGISS